MNLRTTREMRRNEQMNKAMAKKAETGGAPAKAQTPKKEESADKLTLSRQALAFVEEQNRKMWDAAREREQQRQDRMSNSLSALEGKKQELDALGRQLKVMKNCQKIAASIMKGNRVPPEDLEYLMNNDPDGYKLAMAMRRQNPDPEDEKSVLDEEDRNSASTEETGETGESPGVSAPEASSGGGEAPAATE